MNRITTLLVILWSLAGTLSAQTNLSSLPGSTYVLYLDFDGHSDNSGWWSSSGFPNPIVTGASDYTTEKITEVFNRVAEDFRPFNINVTTSATVYNSAPGANRQRVVFTSDSEFYTDENGGAGGVAYLNTFGGGEIACYVFTNFLGSSAKNAAEAASHEAGHTLGLQHHSRFNDDCTFNTEYHSGLGSGQTKWAPIMGSSYSSNTSQWYHGAANSSLCTQEIQDDLAVITSNGFSYRADDAGNTAATAVTISPGNGSANRKGVIERNTDVDAHKLVVTTAGVYSFTAVPTSQSSTTNSGANLDIRMWLTNSGGTTLQNANDTTILNASISNVTLGAGTYYIYIDGVGVSSYKAKGGVAALDYGSLGEYTFTATRLCTPVINSMAGGSRCGPGTVLLGATASAGTISWYATSTSSTVLGTGTSFQTPSISSTTTYFVGSSVTGCATPSARLAVTATIFAAPQTNAGPDKSFAQNAGNQTLTGSPSGGTWTGTGVSSTGVFNPSISPGNYTVTYCVTTANCTVCDNAIVTVNAPSTQAAQPTINPGTGTYSSPQTITLSTSTSGASIYYTTSGNTPVIGTGFTKLYNGPFMVSATTTIRAMAVATGLTNSSVAVANITINNPTLVATPVISPGTGTYSGQQNVSITTSTSGATIFYTTNGNVPSTSVNSFTKLYSGAFAVNATTTIRALAIKSGMTTSGVAAAFLTINNPTQTVATPVISPGTGTYSGPQAVSISCSTAGSTIYYTTSGNNPVLGTSFTKLYSGPFAVNATTTVRAMGVAPGQVNSPIAAAFITINLVRPASAMNFAQEENYSENRISIFPNPGQGKIYLESMDEDILRAEILRPDGQIEGELYSGPGIRSFQWISSGQSGLYLIRLHTAKEVITRKIQIQ